MFSKLYIGQNKSAPIAAHGGFALICSMVLIGFLLLMILSLSTLVSLETRNATLTQAHTQAQANAKFALLQALGQLQAYAGPDQRVTATAGILMDSGNSEDFLTEDVSEDKQHWVGVWKTQNFNSNDSESSRVGRNANDTADYESTFLGWLVSSESDVTTMDDSVGTIGDYADPLKTATLLGAGSVRFENDETSDSTRMGVKLPKVRIPTQSASFDGNYAYWIGDEGVKARVGLTDPYKASSLTGASDDWIKERAHQSISVRHSLEEVGENNTHNFVDFYTDFSDDTIQRIASPLDLNVASSEVGREDNYSYAMRESYHDVTPYSTGVLADVRNGGLKKDLSLAFEMPESAFQNSSLINSTEVNQRQNYFGETLGFVFYEDTGLTRTDGPGTQPLILRGPTWQLLRNYYQLYRNVENPTTTPLLAAQAHGPNTPDGLNDQGLIPLQPHWKDGAGLTSFWYNRYDKHNQVLMRTTRPQVAPVLLRSTYLFSLVRNVSTENLGLVIDFAGVIYNPYNVSLEFSGYKVLLQSMPLFIRFKKWTSDAAGVTDSSRSPSVTYGYYSFENLLLGNLSSDMSGGPFEYLEHPVWGNCILTADGTKNPAAGDKVILKPGEIRVISVNNSSPQAISDVELPMTFGWNQNGGFLFENLNLGQQEVWVIGRDGPGPPKPQVNLPVVIGDDDIIAVEVSNAPGGNIQVAEFNSSGQPLYSADGTPYNPGDLDAGGQPKTQRQTSVDRDGLEYRSRRNIQVVSSILVPSGEDVSSSFSSVYASTDYLLNANQILISPTKDSSNNNINKIEAFEPLWGSDLASGSKDFFLSVDIFMKPAVTDNNPVPILANFNARGLGGNSNTLGRMGQEGAGLPNWDSDVDDGLNGSANGIIEMGNLSGVTYWGNRMAYSPGNRAPEDRVVLFDVPTVPMTSLGSLQHLDIGVAPEQPSYAIGNSFSSIMVPGERVWYQATDSQNSNLKVFTADFSYLSNEALWDSYFFSGINATGATGSSDSAITQALEDEASTFMQGKSRLLNPNVLPYLPVGTDSEFAIGEIADMEVSSDLAQGTEKAAAYMVQEGSFNVNSTSVEAWKALLKGLQSESIQAVGSNGAITNENQLEDALFSRMSLPGGNDDEPWSGYNTLTEDQLNALAEAIVRQVRLRGPFISLSDFVNRRLSNDSMGEKGALQTALDDATAGIHNNDFFRDKIDSIEAMKNSDYRAPFPNSTIQAYTGVGAPGYMLQGDILTAIGPYLSARSDTFIIRAYGDATNPLTDEVISQAWCEAVVQRYPDYVESDANNAYDSVDALSTINQNFGRQFRIISFRWLTEDEV